MLSSTVRPRASVTRIRYGERSTVTVSATVLSRTAASVAVTARSAPPGRPPARNGVRFSGTRSPRQKRTRSTAGSTTSSRSVAAGPEPDGTPTGTSAPYRTQARRRIRRVPQRRVTPVASGSTPVIDCTQSRGRLRSSVKPSRSGRPIHRGLPGPGGAVDHEWSYRTFRIFVIFMLRTVLR